MHNLTTNFEKIFDLSESMFAGQLNSDDNFGFYPGKPKMSDLEIVAKKNYAKTSDGLLARLLAKLTSVSILQLININSSRPINHIKHALQF